MAQVVWRVVGFGLAAIDPVAAALVLSAITAGATRAKLLAFALSFFVMTVLFGVGVTLALDSVGGSSNTNDDGPGPIWAYLEVVIAVAIAVWLWRTHHKKTNKTNKNGSNSNAKPRKQLAGSVATFAFAGAAYSTTGLSDPTFFGTASVVAQAGKTNVLFVIAAFGLWALISQAMMFGLVAANLFGADEKLVAAVDRFWKRHEAGLTKALYLLVVTVAVLLVIDASSYFLTGQYRFA